MNLILADAEEYAIYDRMSVPDGEGGVSNTYVEGAHFEATVKMEDEGLEKVAEAITQQVTYKVYTNRNVVLSQSDIIKRVKDDKFFEILFDNVEKETPKSSAMNFRYTTAKEWKGKI